MRFCVNVTTTNSLHNEFFFFFFFLLLYEMNSFTLQLMYKHVYQLPSIFIEKKRKTNRINTQKYLKKKINFIRNLKKKS